MSGYVKKSLPMLLVHHITAGLPLREALAVSFQEVDQGLADSDIDCEFSGCTCAVAHLTVRCWCDLVWADGVVVVVLSQ